MFKNPIVSPLDIPVYQPTRNYKIDDVNLFWQLIEYNNNLFELKLTLIYIYCKYIY